MNKETFYTHIETLSELADYVGKELGVSDWLLVDQDRIDAFAEATEDRQWIHIDSEQTKEKSPYKTTIAHGFLVLSLASKFCYEILKIGNVAMGVNYGFDRVRFTNAVPANSSIRARISLMEFKKIKNGAKYKMNVMIELKGATKPACLMEWIGVAYV